jgi:hypothetical protein
MPAKVKLQKFVDKLPIPKTISPIERDKEGSYYEVTMRNLPKNYIVISGLPAYGATTECTRVRLST